MYSISQVPPEKMTALQRREEIAALLANGLIRLREHSVAVSKNKRLSNPFGLGFPTQESVHANRTITTSETP